MQLEKIYKKALIYKAVLDKENVFFLTGFRRSAYLTCLHDQNESGFFGGPAFKQPIRAI